MPTPTSSALRNDGISKFSAILQPIRDMSKNWDIQVATMLEEYLADIEKIQISFDGGETTMNFAEAALLIQGSACVYSKKVEYLYTLVYQTLDLIASKKRLQQASSVDEQGRDQDVTTHAQEEEFLSLDDIQECKNIDLKEDDFIPENESSRIIPRTPLALIPMGERDKKDVLLSHTGEVLGSRNDFKMNTCTVHASGALLLDLGNLMLADQTFRKMSTFTPQDFPPQSCVPGDTAKDEKLAEIVEQQQEDINGFEEDLVNDDIRDFNDGDGMYDDDDADQQEELQGEKMQLRNRDRQQQKQIPKQVMKVRDPWELLDPHDPGRINDKPFKKGKTYRIPPSIMDPIQDKNRKRKRNTKKEKKQYLLPLLEFCTNAFYLHASKFPKNPLKAPVFREFEYLYWDEFNRREEMEKKQKKILAHFLTEEEIEDLDAVVPEYKDEPEEQDNMPDYEDAGADYDDDDGGGGGGSSRGADNQEPIAPIALEEPPEDLVVSSYEELVRRYVDSYLIDAQYYVQETDLSRRVQEWEKKILPTLELEETHRPYDIHQYGSEILGSFEDKNNVPFSKMMQEKEPFEVCRYFLATLQLANNYNVEIGSIDPESKEPDSMTLQLLHKTPAQDAIRTYRAPSILT